MQQRPLSRCRDGGYGSSAPQLACPCARTAGSRSLKARAFPESLCSFCRRPPREREKIPLLENSAPSADLSPGRAGEAGNSPAPVAVFLSQRAGHVSTSYFHALHEEMLNVLKCEEFEERVSAYLDGELSPAEAWFLEQHMATCPSCRRMLEGVLDVRSAMQDLGASGAPAQFQLQLVGHLQEGLQRTSVWTRSLVLGLTVVTVLAILLWPQADIDEQMTAAPQSGTAWSHQAAFWSALPPGGESYPNVRIRQARGSHYSYAPVRLASSGY